MSVPIIQDVDQGEKTFLLPQWYQVWKTTGETSNGVVETWFEVVPPDMGPPQHMHARFDECFWMVKGTFLIRVAERITKVSEGGWVFVPRGIVHGFRNIGTQDGQLLILALPAGGMHQYFEEVGALFRAKPVDQLALQRVNERYGIIEGCVARNKLIWYSQEKKEARTPYDWATSVQMASFPGRHHSAVCTMVSSVCFELSRPGRDDD